MTPTIRVLHLDSSPSFRGGQRQLLLLAAGQQLPGRGLELRVLARCKTLVDELQALGVDASLWRGPLDPGGLLQLRRSLARFAPSILHAHDSRALGTLRCLAPRSLQGRIVVHRRIDDPPRPRRSTRWKYSAGHVISVSAAIDREMAAFGVPQQRRSLVYSGIGEIPDAPAARSARGDHETLRLLSIGALVEHKGHRVLLDALARTTEPMTLTLLGEGPLEGALRRQVKELALDGRVDLAPYSPAAGRTALEQADVFVQPSLTEGLGSAVLDAMARGLPVVASSCGGLPELVGPETGWLTPPGDPDRLASQLDAIARTEGQSREGLQALGQAGHRLVMARHRSEAMIDSVCSIYDALL